MRLLYHVQKIHAFSLNCNAKNNAQKKSDRKYAVSNLELYEDTVRATTAIFL